MYVQDNPNPGGWAAQISGVVRKTVGLASEFVADRRGNVVMMVAAASVPLMVVVGAGLDYSRAISVEQRLSQALDAAALAVGTSLDKSEDEIHDLAQTYFDANYPADKLGTPGTLNITIGDDVVNMSASADVKTTFVALIGRNKLDVGASTEVVRRITGLEVVMVLDNTGSMGQKGKIWALKDAARDLVDILFGDETEPEYLKIGLVPFSASVNVGTEYKNSGWIDTTGLSSTHEQNFDFSTMSGVSNRFDVFDLINNKDWNGCVEARKMPDDILDTPPDGTIGDTLWVPYFAPDEPTEPTQPWWKNYNWNYYNSYLENDGVGGTNETQRQENVSKYNNVAINADGPHKNCLTKPITPLTNQKDVIEGAINAMNSVGTTNIPFGMAWGWRVISPGVPFTQGTAYDDSHYKKVIILLTDGDNVIGAENNRNRSMYGAYGFVKNARLGTTNANAAQAMLDERTKEVCKNIKKAGTSSTNVPPVEEQNILIYTITFQLKNGPTKDMMRDCASDPEKYFDSVSNSELNEHFHAIASELSELRISR